MNTKSIIKSNVMLFCLLFVNVLNAQEPSAMLDITLKANPQDTTLLDVYVRSDQDFDEFFAALVFTIRWDTIAGQDAISDFTQPNVQGSPLHWIPVEEARDVRQDGAYYYQTYAGFGRPLHQHNAELQAGEEVFLGHITVLNPKCYFNIINDDFTDSLSTNGSFFVSLNGYEKAGSIYGTGKDFGNCVLVGINEHIITGNQSFATIYPNPVSGKLQIDFHPHKVHGQDLSIHLRDMLGRSVEYFMVNSPSQTHYEIDMEYLTPGVYFLELRSDTGREVFKVIKE